MPKIPVIFKQQEHKQTVVDLWRAQFKLGQAKPPISEVIREIWIDVLDQYHAMVSISENVDLSLFILTSAKGKIFTGPIEK